MNARHEKLFLAEMRVTVNGNTIENNFSRPSSGDRYLFSDPNAVRGNRKFIKMYANQPDKDIRLHNFVCIAVFPRYDRFTIAHAFHPCWSWKT